MKFFFLFVLFLLYEGLSQSDFEKVIKGGDILVNGLSFLKSNKTEARSTNSKVIESVCVKNKITDKKTFRRVGKDEEDNVFKKDLVIQTDGKECVFESTKVIINYEINKSKTKLKKAGIKRND